MLFYPKDERKDADTVIVMPRYQGRWLYVRHNDRKSFEFPMCRRENDESLLEAAGRGLKEEGGAIDYLLWPVSPYGVLGNGSASYGQLYFAEVGRVGDISSADIAERCFLGEPLEDIPNKNIQQQLFDKTEKWLIDQRTLLYCVPAADLSRSALIRMFGGNRLDGILSSPDKATRAAMSHLGEDRGLAVESNADLGEGCAEDFSRNGLSVFREILAAGRGRSIALGMHSDAIAAILGKYSAWLPVGEDNALNKYLTADQRANKAAFAGNINGALLEFLDYTLIGVMDSWTEEY